MQRSKNFMMMNETQAVKYLIDKSIASSFDYRRIRSESVSFLNWPYENCLISFILTARGRINFTEPMYSSFVKASERFGGKVCFTIVEHSEVPEHSKFYREKPTNYVFINSKPGEQFNKCLSYNIGAMVSPKCEYFIFHDLDILVKSDFFGKIMDNVRRAGTRALQCYAKRRVLNCDTKTTSDILNGRLKIDELEEGMPGVNLPMFNGQPSLGSKGGSILLERDLFYEVGGFDPELFRAYSAEDNFFWEKVSAVTEIGYADDPSVELLHMWHEPQFEKNPFFYEMEMDYRLFMGLSKESKLEFIKAKRKLLIV